MSRPIRRGDLYAVEDGSRLFFSVMRVARNGSWADIEVSEGAWTKRQPLRDGAFPYPVRLIEEEHHA